MASEEGARGAEARRIFVGLWAVGALCLTALPLRYSLVAVLDSGLTPNRLYHLLMSLGSVTSASLALWLVRSGWFLSGVPLLALFLSTLGVALAVEDSVIRLLYPLISFRGHLVLNALATLATVLAVLWFQHFPVRASTADLAAHTSHRKLGQLRTRWLVWILPHRRVWLVFGLLQVTLSSVWVIGVPLDSTSVRLAIQVLAGLTGIGYLRHHWSRGSDPDVIRRAAWVIEAIAIALVLTGFASVFEFQHHVLDRYGAIVVWPHAVLLPMALISFVASIGLSVLYRGAIGPSLVIAKTTVFGAVGLLLTCLFLIGEEILSHVLAEWFGLPSLMGAVVTGLLTGLAFTPLYRWGERFIRRDAAGTAS